MSNIVTRSRKADDRLGDQDVERTLRQIQVLLRFVTAVTAQLAGRPCDQGQVETLVHQLILLGSAIKSASLHETEVGQLVSSATGGAMQLLSAENFLSIIARLLASDGAQVSSAFLYGSQADRQDIKVALEIFVDRLPLIKTPVRTKCAPSMGTIVEKTAGLLVTQASLVDDALAALRAIVATAVPTEDPALSKAVPKVVEVVKSASSNSTTISAMSLLELSAYVCCLCIHESTDTQSTFVISTHPPRPGPHHYPPLCCSISHSNIIPGIHNHLSRH